MSKINKRERPSYPNKYFNWERLTVKAYILSSDGLDRGLSPQLPPYKIAEIS